MKYCQKVTKKGMSAIPGFGKKNSFFSKNIFVHFCSIATAEKNTYMIGSYAPKSEMYSYSTPMEVSTAIYIALYARVNFSDRIR